MHITSSIFLYNQAFFFVCCGWGSLPQAFAHGRSLRSLPDVYITHGFAAAPGLCSCWLMSGSSSVHEQTYPSQQKHCFHQAHKVYPPYKDALKRHCCWCCSSLSRPACNDDLPLVYAGHARHSLILSQLAKCLGAVTLTPS